MQIFDELHIQQTTKEVDEFNTESIHEINQNKINNSISKNESWRLHCYDVWYSSQLPWQASNALHESCNCFFSVVQSSSGVNPEDLLTLWKNYSNGFKID
jgi:hypothetical protein